MPYIERLGARIKANLPRLADHLFPRQSFESYEWRGAACLSIVCDDGFLQDLEEVAPILERHQVKGTFAISTELLGRPNYMRHKDVSILSQAGHEIASHMVHHRPIELRDRQSLELEMLTSKHQLNDMGAEVTTLVYPYGVNNRRIRKVASTMFSRALTTWPGIQVGRTNAFAIRRIAFGSYEGRRNSISTNPEPWLKRVSQESGWLVVMLHSGAANRTPDHSGRLERLLTLAHTHQINIANVRDACRLGLQAKKP